MVISVRDAGKAVSSGDIIELRKVQCGVRSLRRG